MNKYFRILLVLIFSMIFTSLSLAQRQTGSFNGIVTDEEGNPLPGVTVTLYGPSLMGTLSYITTRGGDFRFPAVPPGSDYCLDFELSGFQKVQKTGIICNVGKSFRLEISLRAATLEEEVTVTATAPTVDVSSSKQSVTYTKELIEALPLARTYYSIIEAAPGVVGDGYGPAVHGSGGRTSLAALDGVSITDRALGNQAYEFSYDVIDEVELEIGGHPAEVGMAEGAYINIVSKSGGNEFHGSLLGYYYNEDMVRSLIPESELHAVGLESPTGLKSLYDISGTFGGPIIKDKLWFFSNGRISENKLREETFQNGAFDLPRLDRYGFLKLTFQASSKLKFTAMGSLLDYDNPLGYWNISYYSGKYSRNYIKHAKNVIALGMANWIVDQNTFVDFRGQYQGYFLPRYFHPDSDPMEIVRVDRFTGLTTGPARWNDNFDRFSYQFSVTGNRYMDDFLGGDHEIKAGVEVETVLQDAPIWTPQPISRLYTWDGTPWGYQDIEPYMGRFQANVIGSEIDTWNINCHTFRWSAFLQDSLTIKERLTVNFGVRYNASYASLGGQHLKPAGYDHPLLQMLAPDVFKESDLPDIEDVIVWKNFSPRLGVAYDIFGDGTTSFKANYGRYADYLVQEYFISMSPTMPYRPLDAYWIDLDRNGELDLTDEYRIIYMPTPVKTFEVTDVLVPGLDPPNVDEIIVGLTRELAKDFSLGVTYIYKTKHNAIEDVERDRGYEADSGWWVPYTTAEPGTDGIFGNDDDGQITVYGVKKGAPPSKIVLDNPEGFKKKYQGVEFIASKRMSHGWTLLASLTLSKSYGNFDSGSGTGFSGAFNDPNWYINRDGRLGNDRPVLLKIQGSVLLPLGFVLGGYYVYASGSPWGRTLEIQLPNDPETFEYPGTVVSVNAESPGTRRNAESNILDFRLEKFFIIGDFGRLGLFVDILNVMGERGYSISDDPGGRVYNDGRFRTNTTYGNFTGVSGQRAFKVSVRFTF